MPPTTVFLNGSWVPYDEAVVPIEDRGLLFGDAIYEVIRCYAGEPFALDLHLKRLRNSARVLALRLPFSDEDMAEIAGRLLEANGLEDATIYLQVTRGVAPRAHDLPDDLEPTVFALARHLEPPSREEIRRGISAVLLQDLRWGLCYAKTTGLLPNLLARREALRRGAQDAVFVRDGLVTEATSSNVFCVLDGVVHTFPEANILPGVTRSIVLDILRVEGVPFRETAVPVDRFRSAQELFVTGTTTEVRGITRLDGRQVGDGVSGPLTMRLWELFRKRTRRPVVD